MKNQYKDITLGQYGIFIYVVPLGILMFTYFIYLTINALFIISYGDADNIVFMLLAFTIIGSLLLRLIYELIFSLRMVQELKVTNDTITAIFYFRKKRKLEIIEIKSIHLLESNGYLLSKHRCVQTDEPCLEIKMKDGKSYLITPNMERFDELKEMLPKLVEDNTIHFK